jgi:membrane protein YdbS with pleckstrin-like domain
VPAKPEYTGADARGRARVREGGRYVRARTCDTLGMSSYVETLLTPDESVQAEAKQHWVALIRFALQPLLILGAAIILFLIGQWLTTPDSGLLSGIIGIIDTLVGLLTLGLFILAIVWLPAQIVRWTQRRFVVTNRRVICAAGLMRRTSQEARLEKITDVGYLEGFLGRQMGFGDLTVSTAAGPLKLDDIIGALDFKKAIMAAQEGLVRARASEIMGSTMAPSPAAAATAVAAASSADAVAAAPVPAAPVPAAPIPAAPGVAAPAPSAAEAEGVEAASEGVSLPAAAAATEAVYVAPATTPAEDADIERAESPEEITALLARLADLRDSGAISAEEYEAKKQELLGRL